MSVAAVIFGLYFHSPELGFSEQAVGILLSKLSTALALDVFDLRMLQQSFALVGPKVNPNQCSRC
jgi:hypothetical protein